MTDTRTNGQLSERQLEALDFTYAKHLIVVDELKNALDQIAELRVQVAERDAKVEAMDKLNDMYLDQLNVAITDRKLIADQLAKAAAKLELIGKCVEKPLENMG